MTQVLVLDDREPERELLATVLGYAGYDVLTADTGELALALARTHTPDLIIADILMPGTDGYEFVHELRSDPRIAKIPVILSTATYAMDEVSRLAAASGVEHVLSKPCEPEEIMGVVGLALAESHDPPQRQPTEEFHREHLRMLNRKLVQKVDELDLAERRVTEALTLLETILSTAPVGFGFVDRELRLHRINETLAEAGGAPSADHVGRPAARVLPTLWPQIEPMCRRVFETGAAVVNVAVTIPDLDSPEETRAWLASCYPVSDRTEVIGAGIVVTDISERHQAETFRTAVMETMAEGLCVVDREGHLTLLNAAASRLLGWSEDELRGRSMHAAVHFQRADGSRLPEDESELSKVREDGNTVQVADDTFTRKDGTMFPVAYSAVPLFSGTKVRGLVVVFRDTTDEKAEQARAQRELTAMTWIGRIRDAIDEDRLVLYAQPIIPLNGGKPGIELLLRMIDREGELIAPGSFLPVAEKYGLIREIDHWVVEHALPMAAGGLHVHVNLSAESVGNHELLLLIERRLHDCGVDPADITFEITETALMRDTDAGEAFTRGLTAIGCDVALDDFGTGYGSFTYLQRLAVGYLKIDRSFVLDLASSAGNQHLVKAIVNLAHGFGQRTIAEGVEDPGTLSLLTEYGVDFAQGFHLGRPEPLVVPRSRLPAEAGARQRAVRQA
jgi:PAS domain S-box-containing protein